MPEEVQQESSREWWWEAEGYRKNQFPRTEFLLKTGWDKPVTGGNWPKGTMLALDKLYWYTRAFKETEGEPWNLRKAKGMAAMLENMPVFIRDQAQLVGYPGGRPSEVLMQHDLSYLVCDDLYYDRTGYISPEDRTWVRKALDYWRPLTYQYQAERYLSEADLTISKTGMSVASGSYISAPSSPHINYAYAIENGLENIIDVIEQNIEEAEDRLTTGPAVHETIDIPPKLDQWNAMRITAQGVITWAERHSRLAGIVAEHFETDPKRKAELLKVADVCSKVPAKPAEHFHEALQLQHFVGQVARHMERPAAGYSLRPDDLFWSYYEKDVLLDKSMTRDEVIDLVSEWRVRCWEVNFATVRVEREMSQGAAGYLPIITLGGVNADGTDACNELTDVFLESARITRTSMPSYVLAYHPDMAISTLRGTFECIRQGLGYPSIQSNDQAVGTLTQHFGATLEEARSWANVVCMSPGVLKGRGGQGVRYAGCLLIGSKAVELALHGGWDPVSKLQIGVKTGDATKFQTFEEFREAWKMQLRYMVECACRIRNVDRYAEVIYAPMTFVSCLFERCVNSGMDCTDPRSEGVSNPWITVLAWNDTGDSLYAVKKLVFDDRKYSMKELVEVLRDNWADREDMRLDFLNVPKFGNDTDEVDAMTVAAFKTLSEEHQRNLVWGGGHFLPLPENGAGYVAMATRIGALPNGRRFGDPVYDGGISPMAGGDKKGPTAVLRSVSKVDGQSVKQVLLNQRLSPMQLAGEKGFQLWAGYLKTWHDLGIPQIQFNCIDNETLRAAQKDPEQYSELIVRVAGYSAHFTSLNGMTQDSIIARTVQEV